ncbi:hypothetical protein BDZ91DRAFT_556698 [Kalaharituber pfeilii]|nr:hypothetical protein BDZ91DRAFT_556698 [Kalaharituber pfeilii]
MDFLNNVAQQVNKQVSGASSGLSTQQVADSLVNIVDGGASQRERQRQEEEYRRREEEIEKKRRQRDQEGFFGDIKDMWDGGADAERKRLQEERERKKREEEEAGIIGKVGGLVGLKKEEPPEPQGFGSKIMGAFGGQQRKPDMVDHGVDFVQEHVLGQGSQKNEGFVERFKDDQIAGAIRSACGTKKN